MKLLLLLFLTLSLSATATPHSTQFSAGERAVVIRIDDVQDYAKQPSFDDPESTVLQYHLDHNVPALLSIVAGNFGIDQRLVNLTRTGLKIGIFEISIHGWHHVPVTNESEPQQLTDIKLAEDKLSSIFRIRVLALVPPDGHFNQATIEAMQAAGLTLLSASGKGSGHPGEVIKGITYLPETVRTAEVNATSKSWILVPMQSIATQISESWASYGMAVVVIHPRQFVDETGKWSENKWDAYNQMIGWINANGGTIVLPKAAEAKAQNNFSPFLIPVALLSGLTSAILIIFTIRARRKGNREVLPVLNAITAPVTSSSFEDPRNQYASHPVPVNKPEATAPDDYGLPQS